MLSATPYALPPANKNNLWFRDTNSDTAIVFVHGVLSDSRGCWLHKSEKDSCYWPNLVVNDPRFNACSIYLGGYYTSIDSADYGITSASNELFDAMKRATLDGNRSVMDRSQIVFVCHSTGGVVVRHLLNRNFNSFQDKTVGVVFIATPSLGSRWANRLHWVIRLFGHDVGRHLQRGNDFSRDQDAQFRDLIHKKMLPRLVGIEGYENHFIVHRKWLPNSSRVVTAESAANYFGAPRLLRDTDHFSSVKPNDMGHPAHELLVDFYSEQYLPLCGGLAATNSENVGQVLAMRGALASRTASAPLPPIPIFADDDPVKNSFVGREVQLGRIHVAFRGMVRHSNGEAGLDLSGGIRLFWFHGIGGMGKSWLLRRAFSEILREHAQAKVALIDWDSPGWRQPLSGHPLQVRDLFKAIAVRMAQLYGSRFLGPFWEAERVVDEAKHEHLDMRSDFAAALSLLQNELRAHERNTDYISEVDPVLRGQVAALRGIVTSNQLNASALERVRANPDRYETLMESWADAFLSSPSDAVVRPNYLLCSTLASCLDAACANSPMVLILDTCEVLTPVMDHWLRQLLVRPLTANVPLLVLIGSRLKPDAALEFGRSGWLEELPRNRFDSITFDDLQFTPSEVRALLRYISRPLPDIAELERHLHRATRGIPLALRVLLDLYEEDGDVELLEELVDADSDYALDTKVASRRVLEKVTDRFLLHLTNRPERSSDFDDVIALGILPQADSTILESVWVGASVPDRLRSLAQRYSFLATGDLHPTVRTYLRKRWRYDPPVRFSEILGTLQNAVGELQNDFEPGTQEYLDLSCKRLNIEGWVHEENTYDGILRAFVIAYAYELETRPLIELILEIPATTRRGSEIKKAMAQWSQRPVWDRNEASFFRWLSRMETGEWTAFERSCLNISLALALVSDSSNLTDEKTTQEHAEAAALFEAALEKLEPRLPRTEQVTLGYLRAAFRASLSQDNVDTVAAAYDWAAAHGVQNDGYHFEIANLLHNLGRYDDAVDAYRKAIEENPNDGELHFYLSHTLEHHLLRYEEAADALASALELGSTGTDIALRRARLLHFRLGRPEEAVELYEIARIWYTGFKRAIIDLELLLSASNSQSAILAACERLKSEDDLDANELNSLAWRLYLDRRELETAQQLSQLALSVKQDSLEILQTDLAIAIRRAAWPEARKRFTDWAKRIEPEKLVTRWSDYSHMFEDLKVYGLAKEVGPILASLEPAETWAAIRDALDGEGDIDSCLSYMCNQLGRFEQKADEL